MTVREQGIFMVLDKLLALLSTARRHQRREVTALQLRGAHVAMQRAPAPSLCCPQRAYSPRSRSGDGTGNHDMPGKPLMIHQHVLEGSRDVSLQ